jgi:iron-sulfur cluster repair protein YtfE (RIC family)
MPEASAASSLPGLSAPSASFEVPLEMLSACHGRVQAQCQTLQRLLPHVAGHGADRAAQEAASAVMRYFDTAAVHHHADEEVDLFPALIESMAGSDAVCLRGMTQALAAEHRELERRWQRVRAGLQAIVTGDASRLLADDVQGFVDHYAQHIAREEAELLPMARRLLGDAELDAIGRAMRARRGLADPPFPDLSAT